MIVGLLGKPNTGKSTFFSAATLKSVPIADFPFTTIKPNVGMAYLRTKCVHEEMGVVDKPKNSVCANGVRLIPVKLVDVAGLVSGASSGRGLGNQFLEDIMQADEANGPDLNLDVILDVPVTLSLEVGRARLPIRNLLQLNQGSVVELERGAGESLDVFVNGTLIAHGEVVVINDRFGVRLTDVVSPSERIRRLR